MKQKLHIRLKFLRYNKQCLEGFILINYERMIKDCFWEYNFTFEEIQKLSQSDNAHEKEFLFEKILLNSTNLFADLKIFDSKILADLINNYKVPSFNSAHAFKRKNLAEVYFLNKPLTINELKWIA